MLHGRTDGTDGDSQGWGDDGRRHGPSWLRVLIFIVVHLHFAGPGQVPFAGDRFTDAVLRHARLGDVLGWLRFDSGLYSRWHKVFLDRSSLFLRVF